MDAVSVVLVVALATVALIVVLSLRRSLVVVPAGHRAVVERLGRYRRTLPPGRHALVPTMETVRALVDTGEQALTVPGTLVITADNHQILVNTALEYQIVDPVRAVYEISNYRTGLEQLTVYALRTILAVRDLDDAFDNGIDMSRELLRIIEPQAEAWGIKVSDVTAQRGYGEVREPPG